MFLSLINRHLLYENICSLEENSFVLEVTAFPIKLVQNNKWEVIKVLSLCNNGRKSIKGFPFLLKQRQSVTCAENAKRKEAKFCRVGFSLPDLQNDTKSAEFCFLISGETHR